MSLEQIPDGCPHKVIVAKYIDEIYDRILEGDGLYVFGAYSQGKSSLGAILAKATMAHGGTSLMVMGPQLKDSLISRPEFDEEETFPERMLSVDLLVIDDPEQGGDTAWNKQAVERILRERSGAKRSTILTTNLDPPNLSEFLGSGLFQLLKEIMLPVRCVGHDWREEKAASLKRSFEE